MIDINQRLTDLERRVASLLVHGTISEIDYSLARVRVAYEQGSGSALTGWLPWFTARSAAGDVSWDAPALGERVTVLCPNGSIHQGRVMGAVYNLDEPAPESAPTKYVRKYPDGAVVSYDAQSHIYDINPHADGMAVLRVGDAFLAVTGDTITAHAATVNVIATSANVQADDFTVEADAVEIQASAIDLGGAGGEKVARVGDLVNLQTGKIMEGSDVVKAT